MLGVTMAVMIEVGGRWCEAKVAIAVAGGCIAVAGGHVAPVVVVCVMMAARCCEGSLRHGLALVGQAGVGAARCAAVNIRQFASLRVRVK